MRQLGLAPRQGNSIQLVGKNGKKIFYCQKLYSPKKRGSITPPHFWDLDFPENYEMPYVEKKPPRPGSYAARKRARRRARAAIKRKSNKS